MFDVLFPRHGAVLNHNHGQENKDGLTIVVRGIGGVEGNVFVNGRIAEYDGKGFSSSVILQGKTNTIAIEQQDANGLLRRELKVVWDKGSSNDTIFLSMTTVSFLQTLPGINHDPFSNIFTSHF